METTVFPLDIIEIDKLEQAHSGLITDPNNFMEFLRQI